MKVRHWTKSMCGRGIRQVLCLALMVSAPLFASAQEPNGDPMLLRSAKGSPLHDLKVLEYPDLVVSGGHVVVNRF